MIASGLSEDGSSGGTLIESERPGPNGVGAGVIIKSGESQACSSGMRCLLSGFLIGWRPAVLLAFTAIVRPVPLAPSRICPSCSVEGGRVGGGCSLASLLVGYPMPLVALSFALARRFEKGRALTARLPTPSSNFSDWAAMWRWENGCERCLLLGFLIGWRPAVLLAFTAIMRPVPLAPSRICPGCFVEGGRVGGPLWPAGRENGRSQGRGPGDRRGRGLVGWCRRDGVCCGRLELA